MGKSKTNQKLSPAQLRSESRADIQHTFDILINQIELEFTRLRRAFTVNGGASTEPGPAGQRGPIGPAGVPGPQGDPGAPGGGGGGIIVVSNEAELDAAVTTLNAATPAGGIIMLGGAITFTANKVWDLSFIRIIGDRSHDHPNAPPARIILNNKTITNEGRGGYFDGVSFQGSTTAGVGIDSQKVFLFTEGITAETVRNYTFIRCEFRDIVGKLKTTPVFDLTGLNGGTYGKTVNIQFDSCNMNTTGWNQQNPIGGLIVDIGTAHNTTGIHRCHMFVMDCPEGSTFGRSRWGLRKTNAQGVDDTYGWIWQDSSCQIVERTNTGMVSTVGNKPIQVFSTGSPELGRDEMGSILVCSNTIAPMTVNLVPATDTDQFDIGASYEIYRIGTQDVNIAIPAGVTIRWKGVSYTNTTLTINQPFARADLTCVAANVWHMTDSWGIHPLIVVSNEAEMDAAITQLNAATPAGGIIMLAGEIVLTENKVWDLASIRILGGGCINLNVCPTPSPMAPSIYFGDAYTITVTSADCYFDGVTFRGDTDFNINPLDPSQQIFLFDEGSSGMSPRCYIYRNCHFMNIVGSMGASIVPVFNLTGLNGGGYGKWVNLEFDGCSQQTEGYNQLSDATRMGGLVADIGTCAKLTGIWRFLMFVHNCKESPRFGRSRWGARKTNDPGVDDTYGFIFQDDSLQIVEKTNVDTVSSRGNKPVHDFAGNVDVDHDNFGAILRCNAAVPYNFTLTASAYTDAFDAGAQFEVFRIGLGDMSIIIPSGVTLYWRGVAYTIADPPIVITEPYGRMDFTCVGADKWHMTDSWV